MKMSKKLLHSLIALLLVCCFLSAGVTVSATKVNDKMCRKAFSSITVGKKKVNLKYVGEDDIVLGRKTKKAKVKVKLKKGWKLKKITYHDAKRRKNYTVKNGGTIKPNPIIDSFLRIRAVKGKNTAIAQFYVFNDFDD